jgi:hypothetical protein
MDNIGASTNPKHPIPNKLKIQNLNDQNSLGFGIWRIGIYLGFENCNL